MAAKKPLNVQAAKVKLNEYFIQYLTQHETQDIVMKIEKMGMGAAQVKTPLVGTGPEILLGVDGLALDSPMIQLDRVNSDGASSQGGIHGLSFNSPPRSPRASPSGSSRSDGRQIQIGSPMVDELDLAHRQGAMSPHGSPRGARQSLLDAAPTSPLHTAVALPVAISQSQNLSSSVNSNASEGSQGSSVRLSAAFAQMDQNSLGVSSDGLHTSPHTTPTSPNLRPVEREASGGSLGGSGSLTGSITNKRKKHLTGEPLQNIPTFYFGEGKPAAREESERQITTAKRVFEGRKSTAAAKALTRGGRRGSTTDPKGDKGLNVKAFADITQKVCLLPRWMNELLFRRVYCFEAGQAYDAEKEKAVTVHPVNTLISFAKFKDFFEAEMNGKSKERRVFEALKRDTSREYIIKADLRSIVEEVLLVHPGLDFLKSTPDFQERYADTVQIRIMYSAALQNDLRMSWADFSASTLCEVLHILDVETDINVSNKTEYFSYEHFYVLYCKFWELDGDHDFYISQEDLAKYGNYSLTSEIVDRIFHGKGRKLTSDVQGKMNYEDFVWFCLCEEDKTTPRSLDYWFKCTDLDEDGLLTGYELDHFFKEQKARMEASYQETIAYEDILCQMIDMIGPAGKDGLRMADIKACKLSGNFFNALFNLTKFIMFEQRDPFMAHAEKQWPEKTDWDRFAKVEYDRMSHEAGEQDDVSEEYAAPGLYGC